MKARVFAAIGALVLGASTPVASAAPSVPTPTHVVIVVEENHSDSAVIGNKAAPYMNSLAANGALMTQSFANTHPSEPNYFALFSGTTFGLASDACPVDAGAAPNLGSELLRGRTTFAGFSEDLPASAQQHAASGKYARKHAPWVNFTNVPPAGAVLGLHRPLGLREPADGVVGHPKSRQRHARRHRCAGRTWLTNNLAAYADWAMANDSLLVVTWDEDDNSDDNHIPTIFYGANVKPAHTASQ